jgi:hypothetical protein
MCRDNAGCAMRKRSAALETVPSSVTVMKVRAFRRFMRFAYAKTVLSARGIKYWTLSGVLRHVCGCRQFATLEMENAMKAIYLTTLLPVLGLGLAFEAGAETWPSKPIRAIVPFAAGSTTDIIPRVVFDELSSQLGQTIVVENRAGAGGSTGSGFVAKAEPDGYTLLAHGSALTIAPALYSNLNFDPARDLAPVIPLGISPSVLVVPPDRG